MMAQQLRCGTAKVHKLLKRHHSYVFDGQAGLTPQLVHCRFRQQGSLLSLHTLLS
jgi:hypothetical protein